QTLDLDRSALLLAGRRLALRPLPRRRREQRVLGRDPANATSGHPPRNALLDRRGAEHTRLPLRVEDGAVRLLQGVRDHLHRPELVRPPPLGSAPARPFRTLSCPPRAPPPRCAPPPPPRGGPPGSPPAPSPRPHSCGRPLEVGQP